MKRSVALLVALMCTFPLMASPAPIQPTAPLRWVEAAPGVSLSRSSWRRDDGSVSDLVAVRADSRRYTIRTLLSSSYRRPQATASEMRRRSHALVVVNGPFFDTDGKPMGLIMADGRLVQGWPPPSGANGCVFGIRNGRPFVEPRGAVSLTGVTQAVQVAPRLIAGGVPTGQIYEPDRVGRRTGVAVTRRGEILLFCTSGLGGLSFHELQAILLRPEFNVQDGMALDGGASTQMDLAIGKESETITAPADVPVCLGLFEVRR